MYSKSASFNLAIAGNSSDFVSEEGIESIQACKLLSFK